MVPLVHSDLNRGTETMYKVTMNSIIYNYIPGLFIKAFIFIWDKLQACNEADYTRLSYLYIHWTYHLMNNSLLV